MPHAFSSRLISLRKLQSVLLAIAFSSLALAQRYPLLHPGWRGLSDRSFNRLMVFLGLGAMAYLVAIFGIPTTIPGFDTVYEVRSLYAEVEPDQVSTFVRDRGAGFDMSTVNNDRHGVRGSIIGRMERHGGKAEIKTEQGEGTEVRLTMPIGAGARI